MASSSENSNGIPSQSSDWPKIRRVLAKEFGQDHSDAKLSKLFTDLLSAADLVPKKTVEYSVGEVRHLIGIATVCADGISTSFEQDDGVVDFGRHAVRLDSIVLGPTLESGNKFPIFKHDVKVISGDKPSVCRKTDRPLEDVWLPKILKVFQRCGLVKQGQTVHWVGSQAKPESVCMCFDGLAKTSAEAIPAVGSWDELLTWVTTELKGKQRRVMELVIAAHGECSLADLAIDKEISWEYPFDNEFNQIRRPLNAKLKRAGKTWKLCRHDNKGQLIRIGQK